MMLSRVGERIYWAVRYLQRVESSARIVNTYTNLLMDLPKEINISWFNLVQLNSGEATYTQRYKVKDEKNVVKFTLADDTNSSSMLMSLAAVKENFRTTRDVIPESAWEMINEFDHFTKESISNGALNRSKRHEFLTQVINRCHMIQCCVSSTMSHDSAWDLWILGRALERADMSTRMLEAGASILLQENEEGTIQSPIVVWGNVLRSSSALQAYRRSVSATIRGKKVAKFLLYNELFPCSVSYCLDEITRAIKNLPKSKKTLQASKGVIDLMNTAPFNDELDSEFLEYLNKLQLGFADLHKLFSDTWFSLD